MDGDRRRATVRKLPDGIEHPTTVGELTGKLLRLTVSATEAKDLAPGVLVRIETPDTIYLGQAYTRDGGGLVIAVEHSVERQALAGIREIWSPRG